MVAPSDQVRHRYNSIERFDDMELGLDMAFYRTLDPGLGRWMEVDPKAEAMYGMSTYCGMGNSPLVHTDPNGDIIPAILVGAAIGVISNGVSNSVNGQGFFDGWAGAALWGGIGGAVSFGIGSAATSLGTSVAAGGAGWSSTAVAAFQVGAHGFSGGAISAARGGSF